MNPIDTYRLMALSPWNKEKALQESDTAIQEQLTFTNKEEYIAWRAEWRKLYAELSQQIRDLRKQWRAEGNDHNVTIHSQLFSSRALARSMLTLRHASKKRAQELYAAEHAEVAQSA